MELKNDYQNFDDQPRGDREKQENLKPEDSMQVADPVRGKYPLLVFYILLGLSILLSVVVLGAAVMLFTGISEETDLSLAEFRTNISQLQNITEISEQTIISFAELRAEISQLKKKLIDVPCPDQWKKYQQDCYFFSLNEKNWQDAQRCCASMNANLVVINKTEEQTFIQGLLQHGYHWIGLSISVSEGDWRWVDGTDYTSSVKLWDDNQPNDHENENCVTVLNNGKWHDWPCNSTHPYICEKSA